MSLRWRIAIAVAVVAAVATLAVGAASYRSTRDRLYQEIDRSLDVAAPGPDQVMDGDGAEPGAGEQAGREPGGGPTGDPGGQDVQAVPWRRGLRVYEERVLDADGAVVASTLTVELPVTPRAQAVVGRIGRVVTQTIDADGDQYRVRTTGTSSGARQVIRSLDETTNVLSSLRARTSVIVLSATAVAALIGFLIAGRVTASLRRLTAAADTVRSTGRLDVDVPSEGSDEVGRLGSSFRDMLGSLARSRAEQQRLVQDAGHELKTPLTSIRTNLDVLRRHGGLPEADRQQVIADLHSEVGEMVDLVEEVVAVAGGGANDEAVTTFSLGDAAADVVERYGRRTGRRIELEADESPVAAQAAAVQRALSNLLDNAVKFDRSGQPIVVTVRGGRVAVSDRGPGMAPDEVHLVFERFHRGAEARTLPGSGLGLSIVRDVVARNGGSAMASNRDGGGATVGFSLPLV